MDYTVLARRFRPQAFGEVIGQEMVAQALRNAIAAGRVAHAYLFTGARGVGKTSMARILAKSLNCPQAHGGDPCNVCEVCDSIARGGDVDVLEIDGASNRGIEDIRSLRANVHVRSMRSQYKVYIIDEVHMLTREAFNALLKTLEEPPPNVKFIFCTTEPQKVPETILSRCQRFDFGTIATRSIGSRLEQIAQAEGVDVSPAAIELVARRAAGSMRDSQSLFDQLLAFGGKTVNVEEVHRLLGTAPDERLIELVDALRQRRPDIALQHLDVALEGGVQLAELMDQLVNYFRDLMVLAAGAGDLTLLSVASDCRPALQEQAQHWGLQTLLAGLQLLSEAKARMRLTTQGRAVLELALVRVALLEDLDSLVALFQQIKSGGPGAIAPPGTTAGAGTSPAARPLLPTSRTPSPLPQESGPSQAVVPSSVVNPDSRLNVSSPVAVIREVIPLESGSEMEFWKQVIGDFQDMNRNLVQKVVRAAISGPNQLVLGIPMEYHVAKTQLERLEQKGLLSQIVSQRAGRPMKVVLQLEQPREPSPPSAVESTRGGRGGRVVEEVKDPLVNQALELFEATLQKTERI